MLKGNKGEWSEVYVFTKLLSEGKLYQSDINLDKDDNSYYEVLKAYRDSDGFRKEYVRENGVSIYDTTLSSEAIESVSLELFNTNTQKLLDGIKKGKGKSFTIDSVEEFLEKIKVRTIKAPSTDKADIKLRIYDHRLAKEADLGFSIKSLLGQDSTLLNTGPGNNFIYNISNIESIDVNSFNITTYKPDGKLSKITARLIQLLDKGARIEFSEVQSKQFWLNLKMIDGDLPAILGSALTLRWIEKKKSLKEISKILEERDPLGYYNNIESTQKLYEYKLKKFLVECAMGMTSEKPWKGIYDATGGIIIAKENGDVVCFHIYDFNLFREYLIENTIFEQPSTGEDKENPGNIRTTKGTKKYYYGWLYKEGDDLKYKINLQIRFK